MPSGPTSTPRTWSTWPGPARACWPAHQTSTCSRASAPTTWPEQSGRGPLPLGRGLGAGLLDVGPGQGVRVPEALEGGVGHVGEAVPVAKVVLAAGLLHL